jgi:hypothetical protein
MPRENSETPVIDFTRITFPSDRLTIKAVRDAIGRDRGPNRLDMVLLEPLGSHLFESKTGLADFLALERELARNAFTAALEGYKPARIGRQDLEKAGERRGISDCLNIKYRQFRLASGPKQSAQLVRDIEKQAVVQAQEHLGRGH